MVVEVSGQVVVSDGGQAHCASRRRCVRTRCPLPHLDHVAGRQLHLAREPALSQLGRDGCARQVRRHFGSVSEGELYVLPCEIAGGLRYVEGVAGVIGLGEASVKGGDPDKRVIGIK